MKRLELSPVECRTLLEMGIYHPHPRTRRRAQGVLRLGQGRTLQQVADEFDVHLNSVEQWRQRWTHIGLIGLYEGWHSGRPPNLSREEQQELRGLADVEGGSSSALLRSWRDRGHWPISRDSLKRYLKRMDFRYKRCRLSLKEKRDGNKFERAQGVMASLQAMAQAQQCELLYFDETGFSPNPPVQYGWMRIGQTRHAQAGSHRQRVNVLGALRHDNELTWDLHEQRTVRDDVIAFFDRIAQQPHRVPRVVVLDNAGIHKGAVMEAKQQQWKKQDMYLYYLPPYSPELNRIEILWKQAKYFWRKFLHLDGGSLREEVHAIMENYGKSFTINFA